MVDIYFLLQKSFPYRSLFGHIWRNPFLIGILLSGTKHGGQDISLHIQSWAASKPVSRPSAYPNSFSLIGVSLLMVSAFRCVLRTPYSAPIKTPFVDFYQRKLTVLYITINLYLTVLTKTISLCLIHTCVETKQGHIRVVNFAYYLVKVVSFAYYLVRAISFAYSLVRVVKDSYIPFSLFSSVYCLQLTISSLLSSACCLQLNAFS